MLPFFGYQQAGLFLSFFSLAKALPMATSCMDGVNYCLPPSLMGSSTTIGLWILVFLRPSSNNGFPLFSLKNRCCFSSQSVLQASFSRYQCLYRPRAGFLIPWNWVPGGFLCSSGIGLYVGDNFPFPDYQTFLHMLLLSPSPAS